MTRRLVLLLPGLTEPGGAARRAGLIVEELADRGWEIRGIARAGTLRHFNVLRSDRVRVIEVPGWDRPRLGAMLFTVIALPLGLVWSLGATALIAMQITSQSIVAALCSLLTRRPYLSVVTTGGNLSEIDYVVSRRSAALRRWLLRRASFVVVQTEHAAGQLDGLVASDRVKVIPNPVRRGDPVPLDGRPNVLFAGRFSTEKDLPTLLTAWKRIASSDPDARLTLAGAGGSFRSVEAELRAMLTADTKLGQAVVMPGWVADVRSLLDLHDVFVLPSLSEGMSNSLLEACAVGRIVVVSDIAGNRAVVGDEYPLLFPAGDDVGLEDRLRAALYDEEIRAHAVSVVAGAIARFSPDLVIDRYEGLVADATARAVRR